MVSLSTRSSSKTKPKGKVVRRKLLAIDTETTGVHLHHGAKPYFVATCDEDGNQRFWEWDVNPADREPIIPKEDKRELQSFITGKTLIGHNLPFDLLALTKIGLSVEEHYETGHDTHLQHHCLESSAKHGLKELSIMHLDLDDLDEKELETNVKKAQRLAKKLGWKYAKKGDFPFPKNSKGLWKADMWLLRALCVANKHHESHPWQTMLRRYGMRDPERTMMLYFVFNEALKEDGLSAIYEERRKLLAPVRMMQRQGVTVNHHLLDDVYNHYQLSQQSAERICLNLAAGSITKLSSQKQLQAALYGHFKCPVVKETKTGPSTDRDSLDAILKVLTYPPQLNRPTPKSPAYVFIENLQLSRKYKKACDYADEYRTKGIKIPSYPDYLRLYPIFNPGGTATTRFASYDPNQQNVSKQDLTNLRKVFGPLPGRNWFSLDYENIELRIFAYMSGDKRLIKAFEDGYSVHLLFAEILWPKQFKECEKKGWDFKSKYKATLYQWVKNGNFSLIYGASPAKANQTYRHPDAYNLIRKHMPLIDRFIADRYREGKELGYVTCVGGYRLEVPANEPHKAANYYVQGTAGWAMILAMNKVYEYLKTKKDHHLIMTVHDELDTDFPARKDNIKTVNRVKQLMELSGETLGFPTPVDPSWHPRSWSEAVKLDQFTCA